LESSLTMPTGERKVSLYKIANAIAQKKKTSQTEATLTYADSLEFVSDGGSIRAGVQPMYAASPHLNVFNHAMQNIARRKQQVTMMLESDLDDDEQNMFDEMTLPTLPNISTIHSSSKPSRVEDSREETSRGGIMSRGGTITTTRSETNRGDKRDRRDSSHEAAAVSNTSLPQFNPQEQNDEVVDVELEMEEFL